MIMEKSALKNFAEKYVIDGKPKIMPFKFFAEKATQIKEFLRNHRNIKVRMILVCIMQITKVWMVVKNLLTLEVKFISIQKHILILNQQM